MEHLLPPGRRLSPIFSNRYIINTIGVLPAKSILRFKCVSKAWFDVISHPKFRDRYYAIKASSFIPRFLFRYSDFGYDPPSNTALHRFLSLNYEGLQRDDFSISVVGGPIKLVLPSYRGLICFANETSVYLCNPATHTYIQLPPVPQGDTISGLGFGYMESTREYKVAILVHKGRLDYSLPCKLQCSVFTYPVNQPAAATWKLLPVSCTYFVNEFSSPVFLSQTESIYWKIDLYRHKTRAGSRGRDFLLYLDIKAERFGVIRRPQDWNPNPHIPPTLMEAADFSGKLSMIQMVQYPVQNPDFPAGLLVWVLNDQRNSQWIKQELILPPIDNTTILGEVKRLVRDLPIILSSPDQVIICSNPKNMTYWKVPIPEGLHNMDFCTYTENLLILRLPFPRG